MPSIGTRTWLAGCCMVVACGVARALSGSGDSAAGFVETVSPIAGVVDPPATATVAPIALPFAGASDASGIASVELWVRTSTGTWMDSNMASGSTSGAFSFEPAGSPPANHGDYYFDLVAEDSLGNRSAEPSGSTGTGDGFTNYVTNSDVRDWSVLE